MARPAANALWERYGWPKEALVIAGLGTVVSIAACGLALWRQHTQAADAFTAVGLGVKRSVSQEFEQQLGLMRSLQALWFSSGAVERNEFQDFAGHLLDNNGDELVAVECVQKLSATDRAAFEARVSKDCGHNVIVHSADGTPVRGTLEHLAVVYSRARGAAPGKEEIDELVGLDVGLDPDLRELVERAERVGDIAARVDVADGSNGTRVIAALAVRRKPGRSASVPGAPEGFAIGTYSLQNLVDAALAHLPDESVVATLTERDETGAVYASYGVKPERARDITARTPSFVFELDAHGSKMIVRCAPTPRWSTEHRSLLPWVLFVGGLLFSVMVAAYVRALEAKRRSLSRANAELYTEVAVRHEVEKELLETQRKLETLVSNLPGLAYRCRNDSDWTMEFISDGSLPLSGFKPADFYSGRVSFGQRVIHADDRERVWKAVQRSLDARRPFEIEYRIVTAFGDERWVWEQGRGVYSRAGELLALEGFITDISERRRAEQQLAREKQFSDAIVAALPGNFYVFDEQGRFVRWNDNLERVTGYSADELGRMQPLDFFTPVDQAAIARAVAEVFETGSTVVEAELLTKDRRCLPYYFTGVRFAWENTRYLVGVGIDVTDRTRARDERARLLASLLPAQKLESLGVLAGAIAHDFNNRLTVVLGHAGLAQRMLPPGSEPSENLEQAITAARSAARLTRQLLDYADLEGRARRELDLSEEVGEFAALLRSSIPRSITLEFELAEELPQIEADAALIQQLVMNLVLNAAESYGDKNGEVRVSTARDFVSREDALGHATRGEARAGPCVRLSVSDRGAGLDEAALARVGELFFTTKTHGRGLGLAAVLGILRANGGWLRVETTPAQGSVFSVFFPLAKPPPSERSGA